MAGRRGYLVLKYFILALLTIIAVFPFYSMVVMGTYRTRDLYLGIKVWFGDYFWNNLKTLASARLWRNYANSMVVSISTTLCTVLVSSLAGVAYAKYNFRGRRLFYNFVLMTMLIPTQLGHLSMIFSAKWQNFCVRKTPMPVPV